MFNRECRCLPCYCCQKLTCPYFLTYSNDNSAAFALMACFVWFCTFVRRALWRFGTSDFGSPLTYVTRDWTLPVTPSWNRWTSFNEYIATNFKGFGLTRPSNRCTALGCSTTEPLGSGQQIRSEMESFQNANFLISQQNPMMWPLIGIVTS